MSILDRIFRRRPVAVNTGRTGGAVQVARSPVDADLQALAKRLAELDTSIPELRLLRQDVADARADIRRLGAEVERLATRVNLHIAGTGTGSSPEYRLRLKKKEQQ